MVQLATKSKSVTDKTDMISFLRNKKVAIVVSLFNTPVCEGLLSGAIETLYEYGFDTDRYEIFKVPGAFEIPFVAKKAALSGRFDGVVALGCVIRGETPHFEFVSLAATMGCLTAGLEAGKPVTFGVITVNDQAQADDRSQPGEFNKGREATLALFDVFKTLDRI
jgi:6,7-dimethyl-8-ribityllumazine synthase